MAFAFSQLIPLKKVEPVLLGVEDSGRAFVVAAGEKPFRPEQPSIAYHLKEWTSNLWSINASTIDLTQKAALRKIAGNAMQQVDAWLKANNPYIALKNSPTVVRLIEPVSINFLKQDTVLFRFREVTYPAAGAAPSVKVVAVTLQFLLKTPEKREDVFENPLGLTIINFSPTEEVGAAPGRN
jgi:type IV secretory pathway TrbF-like protein